MSVRRWADGVSEEAGPSERAASQLFTQVSVPVRFDPTRMRLARPQRRSWMLAVAAASAALLLGGAVVAAVGWPEVRARWSGRHQWSGRVVEQPWSAPVSAVPASPPAAELPPGKEAPPAARLPRARAERRSTPARTRRTVAVLAPAPAVESSLARETRLLMPALGDLRRRNDPARALARLAEYHAAFPTGALQHEADVATVEALLLLGRDAEALHALDSFTFTADSKDRQLRLTRAELRARTDCRASLADFAKVLDGPLPPDVEERARFGQAACRTRLGDPAALRAYLDRYPAGHFSSEARRRIDIE